MQPKESFRQYLQGLTAMETNTFSNIIGTLDSKNHAYVNLNASICSIWCPGNQAMPLHWFTTPLHLHIHWICLKCSVSDTEVYIQLCTDCFHAMNTSTALFKW